MINIIIYIISCRYEATEEYKHKKKCEVKVNKLLV